MSFSSPKRAPPLVFTLRFTEAETVRRVQTVDVAVVGGREAATSAGVGGGCGGLVQEAPVCQEKEVRDMLKDMVKLPKV